MILTGRVRGQERTFKVEYSDLKMQTICQYISSNVLVHEGQNNEENHSLSSMYPLHLAQYLAFNRYFRYSMWTLA